MGNGKLIAFEGADCAGKSSIIEKLKIVLPVAYNDKKFLYTREPGNLLSENSECEDIRNELLTNKDLTEKKQAELFAKARFVHTKEIIKKLKEGYNVITDRYLLSSLLYQGISLGFEEVYEINKDSIKLLNDNNVKLETIIFKINEETYNKRMSNRQEEKDALEDVELAKVLDRISYYNSATSWDELKYINNNKISIVNANGTDYGRMLIDTLYHFNRILEEE